DSSRRRLQLALRRPDLNFASVRGNVPTRLRKLEAGSFDALVLAVAGLARLGFQGADVYPLDPDVCLPAPGQGAIAVQVQIDSPWTDFLRRLNDRPAEWATTA